MLLVNDDDEMEASQLDFFSFVFEAVAFGARFVAFDVHVRLVDETWPNVARPLALPVEPNDRTLLSR